MNRNNAEYGWPFWSGSIFFVTMKSNDKQQISICVRLFFKLAEPLSEIGGAVHNGAAGVLGGEKAVCLV